MDDFKDICDALLEYIQPKISQTAFDLWFKDIKIISFSEKEAVLETCNKVKKNFLETRYKSLLTDAFKNIIGFDMNIVITLSKEENFSPSFFKPQPEVVSKPEPDVTEQISEPTIISKYTFENFIVGESNKFAYSACVAVAKSDGIAYNPLFIWGPSGLGKTHLLCAITNEIKKNNPGTKIVYKKGDDFTNEFISSLQNKTVPQFREKYRSVDVLLIDDIQFIAGKESTQEEFFNTFSKLYESEKQIILTSDRPPKDIRLLEDRLRTRFEWGLIADIQPPCSELRTAIIKKKAEELDLKIDNEIIEFLAEKLQNNIRQIEGAIKKISAISTLTASPVTMDMCKRSVSDFLSGSIPVSVLCDKILRMVADKYNVSPDDIKSNKRTGNITSARHLAIYMMREMTSLNLSSIGNILNRDHSTVISSIKKIEGEIKQSKSLESEINALIFKVKG